MGTPDEVAAGVMGLKAGGVGSGVLDRTCGLAFGIELERVAQQLMHLIGFKQTSTCLLQCGVMGDRCKADGSAEIGIILQQFNDAAIVFLLMDLEHQACKELVLGIFFRRAWMRVSRQMFLGRSVRDQQHLPWRFAGGGHEREST